MSENTSSKLERTSKESISFPYTRRDEISTSKNGKLSSRIRFKPVPSAVLMLELLKEESSPKYENNTTKCSITSNSAHRDNKPNDSLCNEDESSTNILDTTLIEDDSIVTDTKDLMPGFAWLDQTPTNKQINRENKIVDESPSDLFSKLSIKGNQSAKKIEPKRNDNIYQGLSEYLFKTPTFKNYKMLTTVSNTNNQSIPKMHYATSNNNDSIISSSNPHHLSAKKHSIIHEMTPKREIPHIIKNESSAKFQYTPRYNMPQNVRTNQVNHKTDVILREKNMNVEEPTPKSDVKVDTTKKDLSNEKYKVIAQPEKQTRIFPEKPELPENLEKLEKPEIPEKLKLEKLEKPENAKNVAKPLPPPPQNKQTVLTPPVAMLPESTMFKTLKIRGKDYIMINKLGEGGSGQVYRCLEQDTLQDRAVKVVNLAVDAHTAASYINEVKMLNDLQGSDRVIKMYDYDQQHQNLFVVMEKGDVDFSAFLRSITTESQIERHIIICYWIEMLKCVREIHKKGIIHSDLKPSNFLLVGGRLKLIDFGIASKISGDMTSVIKNEQVGTFNYISPEALLDSRECPTEGKPRIRISYKSDVWSLGCILYQMVYRKTPFHNFTTWMTKVVTIIDRNHRIDYPAIVGVPTQLIDMIKKCLTYDMKHRPSVEELLHMYYTGNY